MQPSTARCVSCRFNPLLSLPSLGRIYSLARNSFRCTLKRLSRYSGKSQNISELTETIFTPIRLRHVPPPPPLRRDRGILRRNAANTANICPVCPLETSVTQDWEAAPVVLARRALSTFPQQQGDESHYRDESKTSRMLWGEKRTEVDTGIVKDLRQTLEDH
jgi:hypothetical protein